VRDLSQSGRREVGAILSRSSLAGAALRVDLPGRGLTQDADADRILADLEAGLIAARDCGFSLVACDLGRIPRSETRPSPRRSIDPAAVGAILLPEPALLPPLPDPAPLTAEERRHASFAIEVLQALGNRADRIGVPLAFSASLATPADLLALLTSAACPMFARELDPVAALSEGPATLAAMDPPVRHVRGRDALAGPEGRTRVARVGEGDVNWPELLEALADADYGGFVSLEGPAADAGAALRRLRGA
jgi:sugar phosphate isomerase/epimerase